MLINNDLYIDKYITQNIAEQITVQAICKTFFISKENLYSLFLRYCGLTFKKYVTEKRIELAKNCWSILS